MLTAVWDHLLLLSCKSRASRRHTTIAVALIFGNLESPASVLTHINMVLLQKAARSCCIAIDHTETINTSCFLIGLVVYMLHHPWQVLALAL